MLKMNLQLFALFRRFPNNVNETTKKAETIEEITENMAKNFAENMKGITGGSTPTVDSSIKGNNLLGKFKISSSDKTKETDGAVQSGGQNYTLPDMSVAESLKTNIDNTNNATLKSDLNNVGNATLDRLVSEFTTSDDALKAQVEADKALVNLKRLESGISPDTWEVLNTPFEVSSAYQEAMNYTNSLLEKLSSGRTSYTGQIESLMKEIQDREEFEYDMDADPLFQQALASAMGSGRTAMQDTIGQASALTGGYGSTYATAAGNQAYNAFIEDAYNNLPKYYQMALEAYELEGQEMYNQLAMLNDADAQEYARLYDAWNANLSSAEQMYAKEYSDWQDGVQNAYNSANLQLSEQNQAYDQAYNNYAATQNKADTLYSREYAEWADEVNNAFNYAGMLNSDYWNEANLAEEQRQYNREYTSALEEAGNVEYKEPTAAQKQKALEVYNEGGQEALNQYVDSLPSDTDIETIGLYIFGDEDEAVEGYGVAPLEERTYTKTEDTFNWLSGTDRNDVVTDQYGNEFKISELPKELRKALTKLKEGKSYTAK